MRLVFSALAAALLLPAAAGAQAPQVRYEILGRTALVASPSSSARAVTQIDSGTVITVDWTEEAQPTHTRVTWNGRQGWIANSSLRRIVTVRDTVQVRVVDTVRVTKVDTVIRVDTVQRPRRKDP